MVRKLFHGIICIAVLVAAMSFNAYAQAKLTIQFKNYVGDKPLQFDSVSYKNTFGQSYKVSMFKYYVGNIAFRYNDNRGLLEEKYFLINQEDKSSMQITMDSIPKGDYNEIGFTLGVDSTDNCSGAQAGALDPINGMFWAWNTGYIFLKMEGISPASNSTGRRLEFHIGGYKEPNNCIRIIELPLKNINIGKKENDTIVIKADLSHLFSAPNPIDFSKISSVTDFHNAKAIADNYSNIFSISELIFGK